MIFQIKEKRVILIDRTMRLVGDNEYEFEFEFDEEWEGKIKTARFIIGDYKTDAVLDNDRCVIDKTFFKGGQLKVGVYASNLATEVLERKVKSSILEEDGGEPTVPENLWTQLLEIIDADVQSARNAVSDAESYARSAQNIVDGFGDVVKSKQEEFDTYAAGKQTEFNQNAADKIREYDEHVIEYTTEINSLKSDLITKANQSDLDRTNLSLDALWKMNRGQTWDTLETESEAYSVDVPSGAKYASVDKVGGKSLVWNQYVNCNLRKSGTTESVEFNSDGNGCITLNGTTSGDFNVTFGTAKLIKGHKYIAMLRGFSGDISNSGNLFLVDRWNGTIKMNQVLESEYDSKGSFSLRFIPGTILSGDYYPMLFDLTTIFGAGNEPATVEEFEAMFPNDYYEYSEPTIISSQNDRIDISRTDGTQQITTNFLTLNSAGSVYDYIDLNEGKLHRRVGVVDLGTIRWTQGGSNNKTSWVPVSWRTNVKPVSSTTIKANILCNKYDVDLAENVEKQVNDKTISVNRSSWIYIYDSAYVSVTPQEFKEAMHGVMLYYELSEPIVTDIEIPTELTDWLEVETGGSITFHNSDDGKRLLIPNKETFVRKLDEVM